MEKLKKEQVYIKINTSNVAEVAKLLDSAGEELCNRESCLEGNLDGYEIIHFSSCEWTRGISCDKKEVTLEQLAEILGVHQFKIGDRVKIKESSQYYHYNNQSNPSYTLGSVSEIKNEEYDITVKWDNGRSNSYRSKIDLELVAEAKPEQYVSVTRENLGKIHSAVCGGWKAKIEELLEKADKFAVNVDVPLTLLKKAYSEANTTQTELLKEIAPLPKEKVTVKVSRWFNVYDETNPSQKGVGKRAYTSKEEAVRYKSPVSYITTIELTGEYETEV